MFSSVPFLLLCSLVLGDVYLHNPPGSNNRNCEKDVNRRNANLLFDSQNNAKGGYACPYPANEKLYFLSGSTLRLEWTAQHGCGNKRQQCDVVLQYMCSEKLRDGKPTADNNEGTNRIPEEEGAEQVTSFPMHEDFQYYQTCKTRRRNLGLWTADRHLSGDRGATITRQNNNGDRFGFECPEERDYYPYWHPSPWKDIAIITESSTRCQYYQQESQNVKAKNYCKWVNGTQPAKIQIPNNEAECLKLGQKWDSEPAWGLAAPACEKPQASRENHLGNVASPSGAPEFAFFDWTIPTVSQEQKCIVRVRYNISTGDAKMFAPGEFLNASQNREKSPITQDPFITYARNTLSLKINTNQVGRTFQDRSYAFRITPAGNKAPSGKVYNLNVRGKRGNIVQTFPAVEYDFVPNHLKVQQNDYIHFQWIGSDYNPRRGPNDAEGGPADDLQNLNDNTRADRHNLVEMDSSSSNIPFTSRAVLLQRTMFVRDDNTADENTINTLAYLGQVDCLPLEELLQGDKRQKERHSKNCAKINTPSPYFDGGIVRMRKTGVFYYMSSRNNNFSNRDQKGVIEVTTKSKRSDTTSLPQLREVQQNTVAQQRAGADIDNPGADVHDAAFKSEANKMKPTQYKDNDMLGSGVGRWMPTVRQADSILLNQALHEEGDDDSVTDGGMSGGGLVGVAFSCALGGLLLGVGVSYFVVKLQ
eukprot:TRINITY_DN2877_c0_g1_i1.p1 TRINITY_DN2877_c0_g1~~TRINITY_DN2877_c0_g1_i1.p1  ORF type:complete len:701 (+),score=159.84 TRINITY_DN2877_c0_g1_i1:128-2230(+)